MIGQWIADIPDDIPASVRIDLEDRGQIYFGHAYIFYPGTQLPGFQYEIRLPKQAPHQTVVNTLILYPEGGIITDTAQLERHVQAVVQAVGIAPPLALNVKFSLEGDQLRVNWAAAADGDDREGSALLTKSDTEGQSELVSQPHLTTWDEFRQWAVAQRPRHFIFRGQRNPRKLVSTFHRTWRKDLPRWISDDVSRLFGAVAERLNYPLQMGNLQHNAAIWSILQHHGYPTPLLDWTFSPFVAAYFAFQNASGDASPRIFIFDQANWNDRYGKAQFYADSAPLQMVVIESMQVANPRHVPQQAISAVTNVADVEGFIRKRELEDGVTYLTVCDLPVDSRPQIMRELELMGITYGSLFPGLDGICRDMKDLMFAEPV